jgi:hypothetical protein
MTYHFTNGIEKYLNSLESHTIGRINLKQLQDSKCRFFLNDKFRERIIQLAKENAGGTKKPAKVLGICSVFYQQIARGRNYDDQLKFITSQILFKLSKLTGVSLDEIEKHIEYLRRGANGSYESVKFPIHVQEALKDVESVRRDIAEEFLLQTMFKTIENQSKIDLPSFLIKREYVTLDVPEWLNRSNYNKTSRRKIRSKILDDIVVLNYFDAKNGSKINKIVPKFVKFDENFAKQMGKWLGDHDGGLGVVNIDLNFIFEFIEFLKINLLQDSKEIVIKVSHKFPISRNKEVEISSQLRKHIDEEKIVFYHDRTLKGLGQYPVFKIHLKNSGPIFRLVFEPIITHLDQVLFNSPSSVRYAFYAGFIEAEGSFHKDNNKITTPFASTKLIYQKINEKWLEALRLTHWLNFDGIPAKIGRSVRLKKDEVCYRVDIGWNEELREKSFSAVKEKLLPFMNKKFYKYSICTELLNGQRIKPYFVIYLHYIMDTSETDEQVLAKIFHKHPRSLRQRVLLPLQKEGLLEISPKSRKYKITSKGIEWINKNQRLLNKIFDEIDEFGRFKNIFRFKLPILSSKSKKTCV